MLLSGPNGVGKSFALAALARALTLDRARNCLFVDFGRLLLDLKAAYQEQRCDQQVLAPVLQSEVIILDDVASGRDTGWSREVLRTIIAHRYNGCLRTFVTANLTITRSSCTPSPWERWAGPHCASRLFEMCYWHSVDGPDLRKSRLDINRPFAVHPRR